MLENPKRYAEEPEKLEDWKVTGQDLRKKKNKPVYGEAHVSISQHSYASPQ